MVINLRDQILEYKDLPQEPVDVPEWGTSVSVRALRAIEREEIYLRMESDKKGGGAQNFNARLVAATVVNGDGNRVFLDSDVIALGLKNAAAVNRIAEVALRLSGIGQDSVEELRKN